MNNNRIILSRNYVREKRKRRFLMYHTGSKKSRRKETAGRIKILTFRQPEN
jgi:hypothetical protein